MRFKKEYKLGSKSLDVMLAPLDPPCGHWECTPILTLDLTHLHLQWSAVIKNHLLAIGIFKSRSTKSSEQGSASQSPGSEPSVAQLLDLQEKLLRMWWRNAN